VQLLGWPLGRRTTGETLTRNAREVDKFDATGRLTSLTDLNNYTTTLNYNAAGGKLGTIADPSGRTLTIDYGGGTRIIKVTDTANPAWVVSFGYDGAGNLNAMTDVGGGLTQFTYDGLHRMLTMLDPNQQGAPSPVPVTNHYDGAGRIDWQKDQLNRQTSFDYTSTAGSTKVTDPKGNVTVYEYKYGLLQSMTKASGTSVQAKWLYEYDMATLGVTKVTDPNNHATTIVYDANGNLTTSIDPLGRMTASVFDALNKPTKVTDPKGVETNLEYNGGGNLTKVTTAGQITSYTYTDATHPGDVITMSNPLGTWSYNYKDDLANDKWGNVTSVIDPTPQHRTTKFCYDAVGRRTASISPRGVASGVNCATTPLPAPFTTYTTYNKFGDPLVVTDPLVHAVTKVYDANRNLKSVTDALNKQTTYTYDKANQLTKVNRPDTTHLDYDYFADGSLNHYYDGAAKATTYTYDAQGRLATEADPLNRITGYGYDLGGNRLSVTQPGGNCGSVPKVNCVTCGYDVADQVTSITYSDGTTPNVSNIVYDADGQRTSMTDGTGTSTWAWDDLHRLTQSKDGSGAIVGYGYDPPNRKTTVVYPGTTGTVTREYDQAGRMISVKDWSNRTTGFDYDADGFMINENYPNAGTIDTFTPDNAGNLQTAVAKTGTTTLTSFNYSRDQADQVSGVLSSGVPADSHSYSYTPLNQLKNVDATTYGYDAADNLTTLASGPTMGYDVANQATSIVRPTGTSVMGYDTRGNRTSSTPTTGPGSTYGYDQANRLTSFDPTTYASSVAGGWYHSLAVKSDGSVSAMGYNGLGQLGNGTVTSSSTTVPVSGLSGVTAVAGGAYNSVALRSDGTVWTWGWNAVGQLGNGTTADSSVPVPVKDLTGVVAIAAGGSHNLALRNDGTVWAWGINDNGQLGDGTVSMRTVPVLVAGLSGVVGISGGYSHSVAVKADGTVWSWGYNGFGQLGDNTTTERHSPVQAQGLTGVASVAAGWYHTVALKGDGSVRAWGYNAQGQLGNGTTTNAVVPPAGAVLTGIRAISAGAYSSMAVVAADSSVKGWGRNVNGQLGNGTAVDTSTPVLSSTLTGIKGMSATMGSHGLALRSDGTVASWGYNPYGALGDGSTSDRTTPVTVSSYNRGTTKRATYGYDGSGLRVSKTVSGGIKRFAWDRSGGLPMALSDGDRTFIYGPGGLPLEQIDATGNATWFHHDQLGSTRLLTDAAGAAVGTFTYDAYGNLTARGGNGTTPLGYVGEFSDAETGMQYLRARYYDSATGQLISRDPLAVRTGSVYGYVGGNPLNFVDPSGLNKCEVGANPLRWAGNATDCASKADPKQVVQTINSLSTYVAGAAGLCTVAGAASVIGAPVAAVCASVGAIAVTVNLGTGVALTVTGNKSPTSLAIDGALAGLSGGAVGAAQASERYAVANARTGGILGFLGVPTAKELLGGLGWAFGWTISAVGNGFGILREGMGWCTT
jgi:RHS repeat-associated protein